MTLPTAAAIIELNKKLMECRAHELTMTDEEAIEQLDRYIKSGQPMVIVQSTFDTFPKGTFVLVPCISPSFVISHSTSSASLGRFCWENRVNLIEASDYS
jgi:hypothetical protein